MIDYDSANRMIRRQRSALTRAVNSGRMEIVVRACRKAVQEWTDSGMSWPDEWRRWQSALDSALPRGQSIRLEDLYE